MIGRVTALVVLAALTGCEARSFGLEDESLRFDNQTQQPILLREGTQQPILLREGTQEPILLREGQLQALFPDSALAGDDLLQADLLSSAGVGDLKQAQAVASASTRALQSACQWPTGYISVPSGGSVTITSPTSLTNDRICGWYFTTAAGSSLSLQCQSFSAENQDSFYVFPRVGGSFYAYKYTGRNYPSIVPANVQSAYMYFYYNPTGYCSSFTCTVTARAPCRCGIVNRSTRIVGGTNTQVNEYPWQVGLITASRFVFCGGSLISDRHIVTAAHCMTGETTSSFRVLLSGHTWATSTSTEFITNPISITTHSQYGVGSSVNNDIAIIRIAPLDFNNPNVFARPICLPDSAITYEGAIATATGWGRTSTNGGHPSVLQEVDIPVVSNAVCSNTFGSVITSNMICTSNVGGKAICFGDSGGPLIAPDGANYELIGVTSFTSSQGCAISQYPSGFTRVTAMLSWIQSNTIGSTTCGR